MNTRAKGLLYRAEVRKILWANGYEVYTPPPKLVFIKGRQVMCHTDIFEVGDLLTLRGQELLLHQVTTMDNKSSHQSKIGDIPCWLWCRLKGKKQYRIFLNGMEITDESGIALVSTR